MSYSRNLAMTVYMARSLATISSLFETVTSTLMSGYFASNIWTTLSGA